MSRISLADPSLVVLVGAAGSGKSTFAARHFNPDEIRSSDRLRQILSGDEADQSRSRLAFAILHGEVDQRLGLGLLTVVDATNLTAGQRRPLLRRAAAADVPVVAIVLALPEALVRARNAARPRVVNEAVVDRHLAAVARLTDGSLRAEGFAAVVILGSDPEIDTTIVERIPVRSIRDRS